MSSSALNSEKFAGGEQIAFLLNEALSREGARGMDDIVGFCEEKSVSLSISLEATLNLLEYLKLVGRTESGGFYRIGDEVHSDGALFEQIAEKLFTRMTEDGLVSQLISPESIEYDPVEDVICVRNNFIPLDFSALKNLLISIGFFKQHQLAANLLKVDDIYREFFEASIIPAIKGERFSGVQSAKLSLAALKRIQEMNEIYGKEAEDFVLSYEKKRIATAGKDKKIRIISDLQCNAGYDIVSFNTPQSTRIDRFIEVKSFTEKPTFFWSENEVEVARIKRGEYFLYLVDRQLIAKQGYEPLIIQNPYEEVFLNEGRWEKEAKTWFFRRI